MSVPFQHLQCLVACNGGNLHRIEPLLEKTAGGFVPEIVEGEIGQKGRIRLLPLPFAFLLIGGSGTKKRPNKCFRNGILSHAPDGSI